MRATSPRPTSRSGIGPAPARQSYLDIDAVVDAARRTGAQAIHPGYGFLSENAEFAAALAAAGIAFIGPPVEAIETMGDKIAAKNAVAAFGVPVVPGIARPGLTDDDLIAAAGDVGYPVLVKPSAGGGGKGMRVVHEPSELQAALASARREAGAAFGDDTLFLERFVLHPRHIEVQVLADRHGNVVHLGERECSLQRRHQKVIEEAPSPLLDEATRARIGAAACDTARSVDYTGAGTVEFIVSADRPDEFFFMEMNTRLQVEHPVTEMVTGVDLVERQVRIAAGEKLPIAQDDITMTGHAIEARVYAEDPGRGFLPTGGDVLDARRAARPGCARRLRPGARHRGGQRLRPDVGQGHRARRRPAAALRALDRALADTAVLGVTTNVEFLRFLLADPDVVAGRLDTGLLDRRTADFASAQPGDDELIAAAAYMWLRSWPVRRAAACGRCRRAGGSVSARRPPPGCTQATAPTTCISPAPRSPRPPWWRTVRPRTLTASLDDNRLAVTLDGLRTDYLVAAADGQIWLAREGRTAVVDGGPGSTRTPRRRTQRRRRTRQPHAGIGGRRRR